MTVKQTTRVIHWNVKCRAHSHITSTCVLADDTYGRLLGRTPRNELAEFNSWQDSVFAETSELVQTVLGRNQGTSDCFRRVLEIVCDPAPSGERYDFTGKIWCPICGSSEVSYGPDNPPRFARIDLALVSHVNYQQLTDKEKRKQIQDELERNGCLT